MYSISLDLFYHEIVLQDSNDQYFQHGCLSDYMAVNRDRYVHWKYQQTGFCQTRPDFGILAMLTVLQFSKLGLIVA